MGRQFTVGEVRFGMMSPIVRDVVENLKAEVDIVYRIKNKGRIKRA